MIRLDEVLFAMTYSFYQKRWPDSDPEIYGWALVNLVESANVITLWMLLKYCGIIVRLDEIVSVGIVIAVVAMNFFLFLRKDKWRHVLVPYKKVSIKKKILTIIVAVISLFALFFCAFLVRSSIKG